MSADQLEMAFQARDDGQQAVTEASDSQDIAVVDQAILTVAARGVPFSANAVRPLLPPLRSNNLVGARFTSLRKAGKIRRLTGQYEPSTDVRTHGHPIAVWIAA